MNRQSSNPALTRIPEFNGRSGQGSAGTGYAPPPTPPSSGPSGGIDYTRRDRTSSQEVGVDRQAPVGTERMTIDDVIVRLGMMLGVVVGAAAVTWVADLKALTLPAALIGFGLAMYIIFKQKINPPLMLAYAAIEGVFVGGFSLYMGDYVEGRIGDPGAGNALVLQAVIGTAAVAGTMLFLYRSGRIRVTPKFQRVLITATIGFAVLMGLNFIYALFSGDAGLRGGTFGIIFGIIGVTLASLFLILDFDMVAKAEAQGAPREFAWMGAFALTVTLVWLYIELLRLLALLAGRE